MKEKAEVKKVEFVVTKPTTLNNKFYGPGTRMADPAVAEELFRLKCGVYAKKSDIPKEPELIEIPMVSNPRLEAQTKSAERDPADPSELPQDFPAREKLIEAGFTTIESLTADDAEARLNEVDGLTKAEIKKIGLALS